jgi:hypothetical protein
MSKIKTYIKKIFFHLSEKIGIGDISRNVAFEHDIAIEDYLQKHLHNNPKYSDPKRLNRYEYNVYSQTGEDGILAEIFERIGTTNKNFVEFGVSDGLENNTAYLLLQGWSGVWLEGSETFYNRIQKNFASVIEDGSLKVQNTFITAENIESLFEKNSVPKDLDLLSIDIDGNDYWVWKAIKKYSPRVVAIECNPFFGPKISLVMKYNPEHIWNRSSYFGSSVKALELLGREKGYVLVGCNFIGNEAFFVRKDLVGDKFFGPYTSENHHEFFKVHLYRKYKYQKSFNKGVLIK